MLDGIDGDTTLATSKFKKAPPVANREQIYDAAVDFASNFDFSNNTLGNKAFWCFYDITKLPRIKYDIDLSYNFIQPDKLVMAPHIKSPPGYTAFLHYHNSETVTQKKLIY